MPLTQAKKISVLKDDVINKIAAGEVIERPASIVRELVDNAIDAGASSVKVAVAEGGQALIRVSDNGCGMSAEDAKLCFVRHATSKISVLEDLDTLTSLGFRGEALSSIAAVAQVKLITRHKDSEIGYEVVVRDSKIVTERALSFGFGSEFEVTKLFAGLPARRKFLKSPRTDSIRIQEWLYHSSLANPYVRYQFESDGKEIFRLSESKDIIDRLQNLLEGSLIRVDYRSGPIQIRGLVAHPSQATFKVGGFVFLLNGRPIQDKILMRAVRDAWSNALRSSEVPVGALDIRLPQSEVDVNVHPQKSEVRFRNSQAVFGSLYQAIKSGLATWKPTEFKTAKAADESANRSFGSPLLPSRERMVSFDYLKTDSSRNAEIQYIPASPEFLPSERQGNQAGNTAVLSESFELQEQELKYSANTERYVGQILGVYLIFEKNEKTFLLDAHAAHERIRFNQLLNWAKNKQTQSQYFLIPEMVRLSDIERAAIIEKQTALKDYGLCVKEIDDCIAVSEMPTCLRISELESFLKILSQIEIEEIESVLQKTIEKTLARSACRSSVMSGMQLDSSEAISLWKKIQSEPQGAVCPHGRPVLVELLRTEIDKMFFRDGF